MDGLVAVRERGEIIASPAGDREHVQVRAQAKKRRAVSTDPVRMTASTRGSMMSARPTSSSGHGTNWSALAWNAGVRQRSGQMLADEHRLGRGLEQHAVARREGREHSAGRNQGEVPRRRDDHHP